MLFLRPSKKNFLNIYQPKLIWTAKSIAKEYSVRLLLLSRKLFKKQTEYRAVSLLQISVHFVWKWQQEGRKCATIKSIKFVHNWNSGFVISIIFYSSNFSALLAHFQANLCCHQLKSTEKIPKHFFANYGSVFEYPTFPFSWPLCPNWVLFQHRKSIKSWPGLEYCCHNFFLFWNFCAWISNQSLPWNEEIGKEERLFVSYCNLHETLDSLLCCSLDYNGKLKSRNFNFLA